MEGPMTRLQVREWLPVISTRTIAFFALGKILLLASLVYFVYF